MTVITAMFWFAVVVCTATGATVIGLAILDLRKSKLVPRWAKANAMILGAFVLLALTIYPVVRAFQ